MPFFGRKGSQFTIFFSYLTYLYKNNLVQQERKCVNKQTVNYQNDIKAVTCDLIIIWLEHY